MSNETARAARDFTDSEPRMPPAMPLRRPYATPNNKRDQEREDDAPAQTSKASIKSSGSSGKGDRFNKFQDKQRQPFKPRDFNQDRDNEHAQTTQYDTPKPDYKPRNSYNRTPQRTPAKEPEINQEEDWNNKKTENVQPTVIAKKTEYVQPTVTPKKTEYVQPAVTPKANLVPKTSNPEPIQEAEVIKPQETVAFKESSTSTPPLIKPASVSDVTPTRKLIPKNYLIEKMSIGDTIIMSVDSKASDCRITRGDYVCLTMTEAFESHYQSLCEDFVLDCDQDEHPYKLVPGETCSYFNPEDGGWYRARCLNPTTIALLDSGKIVTVSTTDKLRKLPAKYETIPEFCAVLNSKAVEVGANLNCKILSQTSDGYKISMNDVDSNASLGEGEVFRWVPTVEYQSSPPAIPEVERPPVADGSKVVLVLVTSLDKAFVRLADDAAQRKYNDILQQVLLTAMNAKPLTEPPQKGQMVIGKFTDGNHYRALVRRTNVKQNKYQIEYVEYGNIEISTLEDLYPCPTEVDLSTVPAQVSMVKLSSATELSAHATEFVETLKDVEELILTLPDGSKTAPSGSEVILTIAKNKVNLNKKLVEMCTPEWKKIEERGGDVVETEHIMLSDMEYAALPPNGCTIEVLDISVLKGGVVCGYDSSDNRANIVFNQLTEKMADYCNSALGREPYLPKPEELCITQLPPYPQWFRAIFIELVSGPGSSEARVCYLDYGNIAQVPVTLLRKMMPEFITGYPVMGLHAEIRDFPQDPTDEVLARAVIHMNIDDEGRGTLKVTKCDNQGDGMYLVDAPELLKVMRG